MLRKFPFAPLAIAIFPILTMLAVVLLLSFGLSRLPTRGLDRYSHALAGLAIFLCGVAIHLGL